MRTAIEFINPLKTIFISRFAGVDTMKSKGTSQCNVIKLRKNANGKQYITKKLKSIRASRLQEWIFQIAKVLKPRKVLGTFLHGSFLSTFLFKKSFMLKTATRKDKRGSLSEKILTIKLLCN